MCFEPCIFKPRVTNFGIAAAPIRSLGFHIDCDPGITSKRVVRQQLVLSLGFFWLLKTVALSVSVPPTLVRDFTVMPSFCCR